MINYFVNAASTMILFSIFVISLIILGDGATQAMALFATLAGAMGQFLAQDEREQVVMVALWLCWVAMAAAFAALILFIII
jgi:hypothetical protein